MIVHTISSTDKTVLKRIGLKNFLSLRFKKLELELIIWNWNLFLQGGIDNLELELIFARQNWN